MYNSLDFMRLERMNNEDLRREILNAEKELIIYQVSYSELEREREPDLEILFNNITNRENYIRKAYNMLSIWDKSRSLDRARRVRAALKLNPVRKSNLIVLNQSYYI